jgi:hypothetical protein
MISNVRRIEMHAAESSLPEFCPLAFEVAVEII